MREGERGGKSAPLCACGCGASLVPDKRGRYGRYLKNHDKRFKGVEYLEEDRGYTTLCWIWQRYVNPRTGYGYTPTATAHRYVYEKEVGSVPGGMDLDHLCRVRSCVNPQHLELVSRAENARRGAKGKLTAELVEIIRASEEPAVDLARRFGVHHSTISSVRLNKTWKPE